MEYLREKEMGVGGGCWRVEMDVGGCSMVLIRCSRVKMDAGVGGCRR